MVSLAFASLTEALLELDRLYAAMVGISIGVALTALILMVLVLWPRVLRVGHLALAARSVLVLLPPSVLQQTQELRLLVQHLTSTGNTAEEGIKRTSRTGPEGGGAAGGARGATGIRRHSTSSSSMSRAKSMRRFMASGSK
jgi:hypothetical protein